MCECYTAYRWLPSALRQLKNLEVDVAYEHTANPVAALLAEQTDVALLTTSRVRAPLRELALFSDEIVFVVAADHALAASTWLTAGDLREHTIISSSGTPDPEARWFAAAVFGAKVPEAADRARQLATALAVLAPRLYA